MLQTPCFKPEINYDMLVENNNKFLSMMLPKEHLYLFSKESVSQLLTEAGFKYIEILPGIFSV